MKRICISMLALAAACGNGTSKTTTSDFGVAIAGMEADKTGATKISMKEGESKSFVLLVVGESDDGVSFTAKGLPAFAALEGGILTIAPGLGDAGTYNFTLTVREHEHSGTSSFTLVVDPAEAVDAGPGPSGGLPDPDAPRWVRGKLVLTDQTIEREGCPGATTCSLTDPFVVFYACDPKANGATLSDVMHAEVEAVVHGSAFTGKATASAALLLARQCQGSFGPALDSFSGTPLVGLEPGVVYDFAARVVRDDVAAVLDSPGLGTTPDKGWVTLGSFQQAPAR